MTMTNKTQLKSQCMIAMLAERR